MAAAGDQLPIIIIGAGISGKSSIKLTCFVCIVREIHICDNALFPRLFPGLFAARVLQKEFGKFGIDVIVLEARDRTGGRTFTVMVS